MILDRMRLDGKVALVTGGSQGLGLGMALALAEAGADVALVARREDRLAEAKKQVEALKRGCLTLPADLSQHQTPEEVVQAAVAYFGRLDILVTAAAAQVRKPILEVTQEDWDYMLAVNLRSVYFLCQAGVRHMIDRTPLNGSGARGKIINIASLTSVIAWPNVSIYGTTKGGIMQMTKAMALEWAPARINVNAIGPGVFHTDFNDAVLSNPETMARVEERIPQGRTGIPEDLAGAAVYLASPASDYMTGQVLFVDGGWLTN